MAESSDFDPLDLPEEERAEISAQIPVISAAWSFLTPFYKAGDLAAAWPFADPLLRLCWAQWWLDANRIAIKQNGYDLDEEARALALDDPEANPLWQHFARVVLRDFRAAYPLNPRTWAIGAHPRVLAPDTEVLYVHREQPEGGVWLPGATSEVVPLVMHLSAGRWRVLNVGHEHIPEPGWPPTLA